MGNRVVVTGLGVVSPIGVGIQAFTNALFTGKNGLLPHPVFGEWNLGCQLGGIPPVTVEEEAVFTKKYNIVKLRSPGILYGCMAAVEAWQDAGLEISNRRDKNADWGTGCIFGTSCAGVDAFAYNVKLTKAGDIKKVGGRIAQQAMNSGVSAYIGGILGLGNQVTTNSSEGNTGTESIWESYFRIKNGKAQRMIAGSTESSSPYIFQAYDSVDRSEEIDFVTFQEKGSYAAKPDQAYTPLSMRHEGFVVGAGSGALVLESLRSAKRRGARIYGEILGGAIASGGLRMDGDVKKTNTLAFQNCIKDAIKDAAVPASKIAYVNGNFQNFDDDIEIEQIALALGKEGKDFPYINSTKSMIGHCLSGSGSLESIATIVQMNHGFLHPSLNATPLDKNIAKLVNLDRVSAKTIDNIEIPYALKISIGLGDVYSCLIFKKW